MTTTDAPVALADQFAPPPALLRAKTDFEMTLREAQVYERGDITPAPYRGSLSNCYIAINMARRIGMDPLMVMQNLYIVKNRPGWSGQFLIAAFNQCGRFTAMRFETRGDIEKKEPRSGMRAYAVELATRETIRSPWVTWAMVTGEHWDDKAGSKWLTLPELMFTYRCAAYLVRTHAPEIAMGLPTREEIGDVIDITPTAAERTDEAFAHADGAIDKAKKAVSEALHAVIEEAVPVTYAEVADAINRAEDEETLDLACDLIRSVKDQVQRNELDSLATTKADALAAAKAAS